MHWIVADDVDKCSDNIFLMFQLYLCVCEEHRIWLIYSIISIRSMNQILAIDRRPSQFDKFNLKFENKILRAYFRTLSNISHL